MPTQVTFVVESEELKPAEMEVLTQAATRLAHLQGGTISLFVTPVPQVEMDVLSPADFTIKQTRRRSAAKKSGGRPRGSAKKASGRKGAGRKAGGRRKAAGPANGTGAEGG